MQHVRKSTFKVLFYLKKNAPKKNGKVAIMGRITIDGKQSQFSTKLEIAPDKWDLKFGRMFGKAEEALRINQRLEEMLTRLQSLYDELLRRDGFVTAERLKNNFLGLDTAQETLLGFYDKFNQEMLKMVEKGTRVLGTYKKYRIVYNHLTRFIPKQYNRKDIPLRELTEDFINDFDTYLRIEVGIVHNTVWTYMLPLKKVVVMAVDKELIYKDPFRHYHITEEESDRGYLLKEEVEKLIAYQPKGRCLTLSRNLFVFSCLTGFAFIDIQNLRKSPPIVF